MYLYHFLSHSFWFQRSYSILWCTTLISYFGVYLDFFRDHLLWGWPCIDSSLSLFLLKLYFLNVIIRISCDEDGLCVCWRISIIQFTELSQTISNARSSVISTSTSASSNLSISLALICTYTTSFPTHFGSKDLILFYDVRLWFLILVST